MVLTESDEKLLLQLAEDAVRHGLAHGAPLHPDLSLYPDALNEPAATFVTLERHGHLRGCVGALRAYQALAEDVAEHAFQAAFKDTRFEPLTAGELEDLHIHISILTEPEDMTVDSEEDLLGQLRPGVDGLIIQDGPCRATFLPSVWESLPNPKDFLSHLKMKAGIRATHWSDTLKASRYTVVSVP